jgi:ubiquinone/menaquinone biosynthesis C-methylase UbiE
MNAHVCPWWFGYFLINPLRKNMHDPQKIVGPFIKPGMTVIDYGCAMGFFTLPMAKMVGNTGEVLAFDIQEKMLNKLMKRASKSDKNNIQPYLIKDERIFKELEGSSDFAILFAVAHEVPDKNELFSRLSRMLKKGGRLLFAEPSGHVKMQEFENSVSLAIKAGFKAIQPLMISRSYSLLLIKE